LTEQEINRKIAEYMGKTCDDCQVDFKGMCYGDAKECEGYLPIGYCHSLDAVWEVEEKLNNDKLWHKYSYALWNILPISPHVKIDTGYETFVIRHATALQCCEAIIKVLEIY